MPNRSGLMLEEIRTLTGTTQLDWTVKPVPHGGLSEADLQVVVGYSTDEAVRTRVAGYRLDLGVPAGTRGAARPGH